MAEYGPAKSGEQARSCVSIARVQRELGWRPEIALREGVELTLPWFNKHR